MSGAHTHTLYSHGHSPVHQLPAHVKLVAALAFTLTVVATPREQVWAFVIYAGLVAVAIAAAELNVYRILRNLVIEAPFVAFAVLLPFLSAGPTTTVLGLSVSEAGLWDAWNILAKSTLGLGASLVLASTTSAHALLRGVQRLRAPTLVVQIMIHMVRYVEVTGGEVDRMRTARASRGFEPRRPKHWKVLGQSAGALFIRSYERGERVHLAMLSRGYDGQIPARAVVAPSAGAWMYAMAIPVAAMVVATTAWSTRW